MLFGREPLSSVDLVESLYYLSSALNKSHSTDQLLHILVTLPHASGKMSSINELTIYYFWSSYNRTRGADQFLLAGGLELLFHTLFHDACDVQLAALELSLALERSEHGRRALSMLSTPYQLARARLMRRSR